MRSVKYQATVFSAGLGYSYHNQLTDVRVVGSGEGASLIAKELIDSKDPEHTLFCREAAFVVIYALIQE